jgi:hypothetical protein
MTAQTMREALAAQVLAEVDSLVARVEALPEQVSAAETRLKATTTQSVDVFIGVANEALSKFIVRTNEIKATLDNLGDQVRAVRASPATPAPVANPTAATPSPAAVPTPSRPTRWFDRAQWAVVGVLAGGAIVVGFVLWQDRQVEALGQRKATLQAEIEQLRLANDAMSKHAAGVRLVDDGANGTFLVLPRGTQPQACQTGPCVRLK